MTQTTKSETDKSTATKTAQSTKNAQTKKDQSTDEKAEKTTQKKPNTQAKTENTKQDSSVSPKTTGEKASANKTSEEEFSTAKAVASPKTDISSNPSKEKSAPKRESTSTPKKDAEEKSENQEKNEDSEQKSDKETSTAVSSYKRSAFAQLATKGFVIQSWQIAVAVAVVVVLVVGGVLLGTVLGNKDTVSNGEDPIVDYTGPLVNNNHGNSGDITLPGYTTLVFPANSKKVTLELPNPDGNPCYFRYTLTVVETGDVLYESEWIEPGKMVKDLTLKRALSKNEYTLRIAIDTVSLADGTTPLNGGLQEVQLIVK